MNKIVEQLEKQLAGACHLRISYGGETYDVNEGHQPTIGIAIKTRRALLTMLQGNELAMAESYIYGDIDLALEDPNDIIELLRIQDSLDRRATIKTRLWQIVIGLALRLQGTVSLNRRWLATHYAGAYDTVIQRFVDPQYKLYSHGIGYEPDSKTPLVQATESKLQWIYDRCELNEQKVVLDVGGGWGSFLSYAGKRGAKVHSIAVTDESVEALLDLKQREHLDSCEIEKINFWDVDRQDYYDAIVCIGTIEHLPYYQRLVEKANFLLKPGGKLHVDGFAAKKSDYEGSQFMFKYIYPGDNTPLFLDEFLAAVETSSFVAETVIDDCYNYFRTMVAWCHRFEDSIDYYRSKGIGEDILRIFRLYLWGIASSFKYRKIYAYRAVLEKPDAGGYRL